MHSDTENWSKKLASYRVDRLGTKKAIQQDKRRIRDYLTLQISM